MVYIPVCVYIYIYIYIYIFFFFLIIIIIIVFHVLKTCFHCRQTGHLVFECPLTKNSETGVGCCYKCGSSEHTTTTCNTKSNNIKISSGKFKIFSAHCNNIVIINFVCLLPLYSHCVVLIILSLSQQFCLYGLYSCSYNNRFKSCLRVKYLRPLSPNFLLNNHSLTKL